MSLAILFSRGSDYDQIMVARSVKSFDALITGLLRRLCIADIRNGYESSYFHPLKFKFWLKGLDCLLQHTESNLSLNLRKVLSYFELPARGLTVSVRLRRSRGLLRCHFPNFRETKGRKKKRHSIIQSNRNRPFGGGGGVRKEGNGSEGTQSQKRKIYGRRPQTPQKVYLVISRHCGDREVERQT